MTANNKPFHRPLDMCDAENVSSLMLSQPAAFFVRHGALDAVAVVLMPGHGQNPAGNIAEQRAAYLVRAANSYPRLVDDQQNGPAHKAIALFLQWIAEGEQGMPNADTLADAVTFAKLAKREREAILRHLGETV